LLDAYATDRWRLHLIKLLTTLLLRFASTSGRTTGPTEGTLGATTTASAATPTRWWTARPTARTPTTRCSGASATTAGRGAATACTWAGRSAAQLTRALLGHHRGVRSRHARDARATARLRSAARGRARTSRSGAVWNGTRRTRPTHSL
jgi:hypothetical protein